MVTILKWNGQLKESIDSFDTTLGNLLVTNLCFGNEEHSAF